MYKFLKINLLVLFIGSFLSSCNEDSFTQVVNFDVPNLPPKLVVNCNYNIEDDSLFVYVSRSRNVGENATISPTEFKDAKVELYKNGTKLFDIPYHQKASNLTFKTVFQINGVASKITDNATYKIKVSANGFETAESEQITPIKPAISKGKFEREGFKYSSFGSVEKANLIQFELIDSPEENFYTIEVLSVVQDTISKKTYKSISPILIDQQFTKGLFDDEYKSRFSITDAIFSNKKIDIKLGTPDAFFFWNPITNNEIKNAKLVAYEVVVYSLTKEKYLYEESLKEVNNSGGLFNEYVVVNSNIKNGFGIFSIKNKNKIIIPVN